MRDAGLFQLHACRELGGPELPPLTGFQVIEELSKADGSVGLVRYDCIIFVALYRLARP